MVDADTCKTHSQLHNRWLLEYFGDLMQYNTEIGECGLKFWAKRISRTAQKHGADTFTYNTSLRVTEKLLMDAIVGLLGRIMIADQSSTNNLVVEEDNPNKVVRRRLPHFRFSRDDFQGLKSVHQLG